MIGWTIANASGRRNAWSTLSRGRHSSISVRNIRIRYVMTRSRRRWRLLRRSRRTTARTFRGRRTNRSDMLLALLWWLKNLFLTKAMSYIQKKPYRLNRQKYLGRNRRWRWTRYFEIRQRSQCLARFYSIDLLPEIVLKNQSQFRIRSMSFNFRQEFLGEIKTKKLNH